MGFLWEKVHLKFPAISYVLWVGDSVFPDLICPIFPPTWLITKSLKERSLETF